MNKYEINEIKKIEKAISIQEKIEKIKERNVHLLVCIHFIVYPKFCLELFAFIDQTEFKTNHELLTFGITCLSIVVSFLISIQILYKIALYCAKIEVGKREIKSVKKYIEISKDELIKLKDKHIEKLIDLSMTDCKLFNFILSNINDNNLTKELLPYYYKKKSLKGICENTELLSIIKDLPINNKTESLISKVQQFLEKDDRKERRSETFENAINKKMGNKIKII